MKSKNISDSKRILDGIYFRLFNKFWDKFVRKKERWWTITTSTVPLSFGIFFINITSDFNRIPDAQYREVAFKLSTYGTDTGPLWRTSYILHSEGMDVKFVAGTTVQGVFKYDEFSRDWHLRKRKLTAIVEQEDWNHRADPFSGTLRLFGLKNSETNEAYLNHEVAKKLIQNSDRQGYFKGLRNYLDDCTRKLEGTLKEIDPSITIDWFGDPNTTRGHLEGLVEHEMLHHGEWVIFMKLSKKQWISSPT